MHAHTENQTLAILLFFGRPPKDIGILTKHDILIHIRRGTYQLGGMAHAFDPGI